MKQLSYAQWRRLPPMKAARWLAKRLGLDKERERKLVLILQSDWKR